MKVDALKSVSLISLIDELNKIGVNKGDIINIFQNNNYEYIAVFYAEPGTKKTI